MSPLVVPVFTWVDMTDAIVVLSMQLAMVAALSLSALWFAIKLHKLFFAVAKP